MIVRRSGIAMTMIFSACALAPAIFLGVTLLAASAQGPFIYPNKGQSQEQQNRDRFECHSWAVSQTGYDPTRASAPTTYAPAPTANPLRGAAGGAALGAVGGAIAGNPGKGAAIGAGTGALIGGMRRHEQARQQATAQSQQAAATNAQINNYNRALATCLQGRGYTVN
jgi:YMGG-like Gly-zipper